MRSAPSALLLGAALLGLAACQTTQDSARSSAAAAPQVSAADLIAARQAGMRMTAAIVFGQLKPAAGGTGELKPLANAAQGLASWGGALPGLFADGSGGSPSKAKPELWANKADFNQKAAAFEAAATAAAAAAKAEDRAAFTAQVNALQQSCGGCHKAYRMDEQH